MNKRILQVLAIVLIGMGYTGANAEQCNSAACQNISEASDPCCNEWNLYSCLVNCGCGGPRLTTPQCSQPAGCNIATCPSTLTSPQNPIPKDTEQTKRK